MSSNNVLVVLKGAVTKPALAVEQKVVSFEELKSWVTCGVFLKHMFRYACVRLETHRGDVLAKPFLTYALMRLMSRNECIVQEESGACVRITAGVLVREFLWLLGDSTRVPALLRRIRKRVEVLATTDYNYFVPNFEFAPVYLRSDLWFGVRSGGSVGHIAGVLNNLDKFTGTPIFVSSDSVPTVRPDLEAHFVPPGREFWDFQELTGLHYNQTFLAAAERAIGVRPISFVYQRYGLNNFTGLELAMSRRVPFVLEYNGSEVWIHRNWGKPLHYERLSEEIEMLNLRRASLVVVVSEPMKDELIKRGIAADKILVNPNGVDPDRYSPEVNGRTVRERLGIGDESVIGFIGTFGRWHGAEVLTEAYGRLLQAHPEYRGRTRLLLVGDGVTMPMVQERIDQYGLGDRVITTGLVPQEQGPEYLAACDVLASPHVPNPDGTPFFGSPTKLFEYMAMGKGIVASDLNQIGEILRDRETALLIPPGSIEGCMLAIKTLVDQPEFRNQLGQRSRQEVLQKYTWTSHTRRIIERLRERCL